MPLCTGDCRSEGILAFFASVCKKKKSFAFDYCNLEASSYREEFLIVETRADCTAFIYLLVAGPVLV